jgi:hypothetical protein
VSFVEGATSGTINDPLTPVTTGCGFCRSEATTYPAQFVELTILIKGLRVGVGDNVGVGEKLGIIGGDVLGVTDCDS